MKTRMLFLLGLLILVISGTLGAQGPGLANPFYAMDTSFKRAGLSTSQQLDLVKELGYAGISWSETAPDKAQQVAEECRKRGLKMFTIYCGAKVTLEGDLTTSPRLKDLMGDLKDHGTVIWLYLLGKGPKVEELTGKEPLVRKLRDLADAAAADNLRIAIYPHAGFWIARVHEAIKLARVVQRKNFGVTFNLVHSLMGNDEKRIPELLDEAAPLLFSVTINGADTTLRPGPRNLIQTLDKGSYDVAIVLRKIRDLGYRGPIGFQGFGIKGESRSILAPTMKAWQKLSAAVASPATK